MKRIEFAVLESIGSTDRIENVKKMKAELPELHIFPSDKNNVFDNHIKLFEISDDLDGIVILEDDVKLCKKFKDRLQKILTGHENEVVSMFESACSRKPLKSEYRAGSRFAWNQCNYYPKNVANLLYDSENVKEFKKWYEDQPWNYPIDTYIAYVFKKYKIKYWMSVPFLVQHLDFKSNFPGRPSNRQSKYFIDDVEGEK